MNLPKGYTIVPDELTEEMQVAGIFAASQMQDVTGLERLNEKRRAIYRAQLKAAPTPPEIDALRLCTHGLAQERDGAQRNARIQTDKANVLEQENATLKNENEQLRKAMELDAPSRGIFKQTAELSNWSVTEGKLFGQVRRHSTFTDGAWVLSSKIIEWSQDYRLCETQNTIYILGAAAILRKEEKTDV